MTEMAIKRAERKAKAIDLLGEVCQRCGTTNRLEFDHIKNDRLDERHMVSRLLLVKWDRVVLELQKCQLLCRICHTAKTNEDAGHYSPGTHGVRSTYINHGCRCRPCTVANTEAVKEYYRHRTI